MILGLVKAKQYDWKDSNLALFGSDTEKQVKSRSLVSKFIKKKLNCYVHKNIQQNFWEIIINALCILFSFQMELHLDLKLWP